MRTFITRWAFVPCRALVTDRTFVPRRTLFPDGTLGPLIAVTGPRIGAGHGAFKLQRAVALNHKGQRGGERRHLHAALAGHFFH